MLNEVGVYWHDPPVSRLNGPRVRCNPDCMYSISLDYVGTTQLRDFTRAGSGVRTNPRHPTFCRVTLPAYVRYGQCGRQIVFISVEWNAFVSRLLALRGTGTRTSANGFRETSF